MSENRLIDLESRFAFQEISIQELSDALYQQQQRIDQLTEKLAQFQIIIRDMSSPNQHSAGGHEKPPHY